MNDVTGKVARRGRESGLVLIEMAVMLPIFVTITLLCLDAQLVLLAARFNDMACRNAARAAAEASSQSDATSRAKTALRAYKTDNPFLTSPQLDGVVIFETRNGDPLAGPFVGVTTRVSAKLPAPIVFC